MFLVQYAFLLLIYIFAIYFWCSCVPGTVCVFAIDIYFCYIFLLYIFVARVCLVQYAFLLLIYIFATVLVHVYATKCL